MIIEFSGYLYFYVEQSLILVFKRCARSAIALKIQAEN